MSEARKCDRCHGFYDIAEEQQDRDAQYEFKGDYINLHLWVARNGVRKDVMSQWYDLCPKCMMELECWLNNNEFPTICEPDKDADCIDRSNGATEKELELPSKLNDAKIYIAQLKSELGYTMTKEEIEFMKDSFKSFCLDQTARHITKALRENDNLYQLMYEKNARLCRDNVIIRVRLTPFKEDADWSRVPIFTKINDVRQYKPLEDLNPVTDFSVL